MELALVLAAGLCLAIAGLAGGYLVGRSLPQWEGRRRR
jgi:hypothetical protein